MAKYIESADKYRYEFYRLKREYEEHIFGDKDVNPKQFFNYVRRQTSVCSSIPCMKTDDGDLIATDGQKAELFSEYFANVFVQDNNIMPPFSVDNVGEVNAFTCDTRCLVKIVKKLKSGSSPGPDMINAHFLKNIIANIANPLCTLFDKCLSEGFVPNEWKVAYVIPIHKKGDPQSPDNYRPVSLTSVLCKILERLVRNQLLDYLRSHNIFPSNQHGFVAKKSTVSNLIECLDDWTSSFDRAVQTDIIYLDYSKCFDSVVHSKLLFKLSNYGFNGSSFRWIKNFLTGRKQYVRIGTSLSTSRDVISGVP